MTTTGAALQFQLKMGLTPSTCMVYLQQRKIRRGSVPTTAWKTPPDHRHLWINLTAESSGEAPGAIFSGPETPR